MRKLQALFLIVLAAVSLANFSRAQGIDGTLRGEVKDPSGAMVPDAKVVVTNEGTKISRTLQTTAVGTFDMPNLLTGLYTVIVELQGFKKYVRKGVEVKTNQVTEVNAVLEIGAAGTVVEVISGGELVQTTTAQLGESWTGRQITEIPLPALNGNPQNLAILQVGTTTQSGGVVGEGGAIGGNRPRNNNFVLDGVDNNRQDITGVAQQVIPDAVAEFTLLTNQFSAEYGHSTAGQFILTTKSGTNELHGSAFWFVNNRNLNSVDNLTKAAIEGGQLDGKPRFDQNRLGGTLGGPLWKDRLFVFGAYQYQTAGLASTPGSATLVPTAAGFAALTTLASAAGSGVSQTAVSALTDVLSAAPTASQTVNVFNRATGGNVPVEVGVLTPAAPNFFNQHDYNINVDYNAGAHRVSGRYMFGRFRAPFVANFPVPVFTGAQENDTRSATLSDVYTIRPTVVNEFRAGYRRFLLANTVPNLTPPGALDVYPNIIIEDLTGLEIGPFGDNPQSNIANAYQYSDTLSIARNRHNFKLGADFRLWTSPSFFLPRGRAEYRYSDLNTFVQDPVPDNLALRGVGDGSFSGNQKAIYWFVQDDWKVHSRLTLNLGLRYEFATNPRDAAKQGINATADLALPGNSALRPLLFRVPKQDLNNFAPRIGYAWDVFGDGKTSVRGGFAVAYDVLFTNLVTLQLPPQLQQELDPGQACALTPAPSWCATNRAFLAGGGIPGTFIPQTLDPATARAFTQAIIVDTVAPKSLTWTLSVQREFWKNYSVELNYVGTRGISLPVQIRRNARTVPPANLFLPTFFTNAEVPASAPLSAPSLATFAAAANRPYAADGFLANITAFDPIGNSIYHGGSIDVTRRMSSLGRWGNGLFLKSGYTWSRAIDDSTNELNTSQINPRRPQNHTDLRSERGLSAIHHAHKFTLVALYELPKYGGGNSLLAHLINQWQVSAAFLAESGQWVTPLSFIDANGNGDAAGDRAIINPNFTAFRTVTDVNAVCRNATTGATSVVTASACAADSTVGYVAQNSAAQFVRARPGARANSGRNILPTAGLNNWNLTFFKRTNITEHRHIEFRMEMLNAFNHAQPILGSGNINIALANSQVGTAMAAVGNNPSFNQPDSLFSTGAGNGPFSRLIQFGLKVVF